MENVKIKMLHLKNHSPDMGRKVFMLFKDKFENLESSIEIYDGRCTYRPEYRSDIYWIYLENLDLLKDVIAI